MSDQRSDATPGIVAPVEKRAETSGFPREMAVRAGAIRPDKIRLIVVTHGGGGPERDRPRSLFRFLQLSDP